MRKYFFTSDTHYSHGNIIKYANRPYATSYAMNKDMIKRHNSVVGKNDIVYFIGDFTFEKNENYIIEILESLNGELHLVPGNHDQPIRHHKFDKYFKRLPPIAEIYIQDDEHPRGKQHIVLCHYAMRVWNKSHHGSYHLYGHSHGSLPDDPNSLSCDVGVDCWDFYPVSYEQIKEKMSKKNWKPIDHHGRD